MVSVDVKHHVDLPTVGLRFKAGKRAKPVQVAGELKTGVAPDALMS